MAKTYQQILGHLNLMQLVTNVKAGIPDPLPPGFARDGRNFLGKEARYNRVQGVRQTARAVAYGSPAAKRDLKGIDEVDVSFLHFKEMIQLDIMTLQNLRSYDNQEAQNLGEQEVARHIANLTQLFVNNRIALRQLVLAKGEINCDTSGNLLPSSSGSARTTSFQMPAGNQNQLNVFSAGNLVTASFALSTTNIPLIIANILSAALKLTGYPIWGCIYGKRITTDFSNNDFMQPYLARNPQYQTPLMTSNIIPNGLLDIPNWYPAYTSFFEDQNGTNQDIIADDSMIFFPQPTAEWWSNPQGSYPVPNTIDIRPDLQGPASSFDLKYGMFGFSKPDMEPPFQDIVEGDTTIPLLQVPAAIFQADVEF